MTTVTIISLAIVIVLAVILVWGRLPEKTKAPILVGAAITLALLGHIFRQATKPQVGPPPPVAPTKQTETLEAALDDRTEKEIAVLVEAVSTKDYAALDDALNHDLRRR